MLRKAYPPPEIESNPHRLGPVLPAYYGGLQAGTIARRKSSCYVSAETVIKTEA